MARENRQLIECTDEIGNRRGERDPDRVALYLAFGVDTTGADRIGQRRLQLSVQQLAERVIDVIGSEWTPVGEFYSLPDMKKNRFALARDRPLSGQFRLCLLRGSIDANQDAFGQITDRVRNIV